MGGNKSSPYDAEAVEKLVIPDIHWVGAGYMSLDFHGILVLLFSKDFE